MSTKIFHPYLAINNKKTLVMGIGGGYDVYTCLPWFLGLSVEEQDCCIIANYTFTEDVYKYTTDEQPYVAEIGPDSVRTQKNNEYFPEHHLAQKLNKIIYTFRLVPCPLLIGVLDDFVVKHNIEQIFLFDGGVDSIIFGNEGMVYGSPLEDSQMIIASVAIVTKHKLPSILITSALGIDDCDIKSYLEHWKQLSLNNATFAQIKLTSGLPGWNLYKDICQTAEPPSIIQESIIAAVDGYSGMYLNPRLYPCRIPDKDDMPLIRPETSDYWLWDPIKLFEYSPFYQNMAKFLEIIKDKSIDECWIYWNQCITLYMAAENSVF